MRSLSEVRSTLTFWEQFDEYQTLGYSDWEAGRRMGIRSESMLRMLEREGRDASMLLRAMAKEERDREYGQR